MPILHRQSDWQEPIARTGFFTSLCSYLVFWGLDLLRPGFVARYLSVHLFLLSSILFGYWWSKQAKKGKDLVFLQYATAILSGFFLAMVSWKLGEGLQEFRILFSVLSAALPLLFLRLIRS